MKIEDRNNKFYTEHGLKALKQRLKTFIDFYNKNEFPISHLMFGFGNFQIENKEECGSRIKELSELTGIQMQITIEKIKQTNGSIITKETINDDC